MKNLYSTPPRHLGQREDLRVTTTELKIFFKTDIIKHHLLFSIGVENHYRTDPEDIHKGTAFVERAIGRIMKWAVFIGPFTATVGRKDPHSVKES